MLRFLADENFDIRIVHGIQGQAPEVDVLLLALASHPGEWEGRVLFLPL